MSHQVHLTVRASDEMMEMRAWLGGMVETVGEGGDPGFVTLVERIRVQLPEQKMQLQGPGYQRLVFPTAEDAGEFGAAVIGFATMFDHGELTRERALRFGQQIMEQSMWRRR